MNFYSRNWSPFHANDCVFSRNEQQKVYCAKWIGTDSVSSAFSKSSVFVDRFHRVRVNGRRIRKEKVAFSNENGYVLTGPESENIVKLVAWLVYARTYCVPIATLNRNKRTRLLYFGDAQIISKWAILSRKWLALFSRTLPTIPLPPKI